MRNYKKRFKFDPHAHSTFSDSELSIHELSRVARENGIRVLGIADHCRVIDPSRTDDMALEAYMTKLGGGSIGRVHENIESRREAIAELNIDNETDEHLTNPEIIEAFISYKEEYGDEDLDTVMDDYIENKPILLNNIELDYELKNQPEISDFLETNDFHTTIFSIHYIEDIFDGDKLKYVKNADLSDYNDRQIEELVEGYFRNLDFAIISDMPDMVAHPNLIQTNPYVQEFLEESNYDIESRYANVLDLAERHGVMPELNLKTGSRIEDNIYEELIFETETPYTIGSDTHRAGEMAERSAYANDLLANVNHMPVEPEELLGMAPKDMVKYDQRAFLENINSDQRERLF